MQLRSITIENFRRLVRPVHLAGLVPGLNVIAGDNEEGKSTVLEAIQAALFEKHTLTGERAAGLQPFGSSVRPQVELEFVTGGQTYRLSKGFCQGKFAQLEGDRQQWSGPAAEEKLQELFNFTPPGRGASKPQEHHGVSGLLWVRQGTAFEEMRMGDPSRNALQSALEAQVGDVLGGDRREKLLKAIAEARKPYFTDKKGQPAGPYRQAQEQVTGLEETLQAVQEQLAGYDQKVDQLQRQQAQLADLDRPEVIRELIGRRDRAQQDWDRLQTLRRQVAEAEQALRLAQAEGEGPQTRWTQRQEAIQSLARQQEELARLQQHSAETRPALERAEAALAGLQKALEEAEGSLTRAQDRERRAEADLQRAEKAGQRDALAQAHRQGRRTQELLQQVVTTLAAIRVEPQDMDGLRELEKQLNKLEGKIEAGATRLDLALSVPVTDADSGRPAPGRMSLTAATTLRIGSVGTLTITPGGKGLEETGRQRDRLRQERDQALERLGVKSIEGAQEQLNQRQSLERQRQDLQAQLQAQAPEGLEGLERQLAHLERELEGQVPPGLQQARQALQEAREGRESARQALAHQTREVEAARNERQKQWQIDNQHQATLEARQGQLRDLEARLEQARRTESDQQLQRAVEDRQERLEQAQAQADQTRQAEQAAQPERIDLELETSQRAVEQHQERVAALKAAVHELQIELRSGGQMELGEKQEQLRADLEQARQKLAAVTREAESLQLLHQVLQEAARQARQTFLGPVLEKIRPYLDLLMPRAELMLDEAMTLQGIRRDGQEEPFDCLSIGTREQLAVLVRLAFGELLSESGQPVVLILDDALVYADTGRLENMKMILARAARKFQVLILTCREADYRSLGAFTLRLGDCGR